uniref:High mobility group n=1 Tax=Oidium heveae TaxID=299130 RepID=A0A1D8X964_OIDHE|nr:high mobility group [Oidium heveae]
MCTENLQSNSSYIILDVRRFLENWQDAIDENGLTFWFGFKSGSHLHQFGNLECIVQTWSNHVGASVYVHYFKNIDAYRIGQIYNNDVALQVKQAVFILKRDPVTSTSTQHISETITSTSPSIKPSFDKLKLRSLNTERLASNPHAYCSQHIRKPRNAWIIFRQETMVKFRDQIGHLHTSEQSKVISKMWKKTPKHIKDLYTSRAHKEKADLLEQYPNYRVQPRKSSEIRKRIRNKYPVSLTVEDLNEWVQTQSAFSQNSCSIKRSPNSSGFFNSDAEKLGTRQVQSNNDQHILSEKNSCSQFFAQRENN